MRCRIPVLIAAIALLPFAAPAADENAANGPGVPQIGQNPDLDAMRLRQLREAVIEQDRLLWEARTEAAKAAMSLRLQGYPIDVPGLPPAQGKAAP